ncbi:MAG: SpoIIE family protein phosphatase, partial [Leptospiraceae bacterium]|nr:SpoIIE family protein phosphatase [Leptospiraceae bacterium]
MKFRTKLFSILGLSQIMLTLVLTSVFVILVEKVKNEPQDKRAMEQANQFQRELAFKEEKLKLLISSITSNSRTIELLQAGLNNREILKANTDYFQEIMKTNSLSIFEVGDNNGKVHFRFHRPADFGDDKSGQKIIQAALNGQISSTLESGHSGLGYRMTAPLRGGTILIGQKVDDEFTSEIAGADKTHIAVFEKKELRAASSSVIKEFVKNYTSIDTIISKERIYFQNENYYVVKIPYENKGLTNLSLEFLLLINETELNAATEKIWIYFYFILFFVIGIGFFISYLFSKDIIRAVNALNHAMSNIDKDEKLILDLHRKDEIGQMSNVFVKMKSELFSYQHHLEEMVEIKTRELQKSLAEINDLKVHQDGDYFLTSLLLKPLSNGNIKTENIVIESLIRQKKNFQFRNKFSEIGGDLCAVNQIYLKEKKYTVFMNADAMGKSLQGAGGALVMGTVFKSIIQNTISVPSFQNKYPEKWLKDCYQELQNVFISFDGSMLISCVIGLICEE